jgi:hypothetical protein
MLGEHQRPVVARHARRLGGHYDVVRELLRLDANLLIKLTSLRPIRRLESFWDDDMPFAGSVSWMFLDVEIEGAGDNGKRSGVGDHGSETPAAHGGARPFTMAQGEEGIISEPDSKAKALPLPTAHDAR